MSKPEPSRCPVVPPWLVAMLLVLVTLGLYWPALHCDFVAFDDGLYITSNLHVQKGLTWEGFKWAWLNPVCFNWHPLTVWSNMLVCQLFGLKAWAHHFVNVLLHGLNTGLLFLLLHRLTRATWRSLFVAMLFGWHPIHVESVAWVAERKDVLSGFFFMLTLLCYVKYAQKTTGGQGIEQEITEETEKTGETTECSEGKTLPTTKYTKENLQQEETEKTERDTQTTEYSERKRKGKEEETTKYPPSSEALWRTGAKYAKREKPNAGKWMWYFFTLAAFACGLMSKPMLVTVPFVLLLLDFWPLGRMVKEKAADGCRTPQAGATVHTPLSSFGFSPSLAHSTFDIRHFWRLLAEKLPFFILAAIASVVTFIVLKRGGILMTSQSPSLSDRVGNALISYCRYLGKLFWPANLAVFYPHPGHWPLATVLLAGALLAAITILVWFERRRAPYLLMGWLWFCGMLVPVSQIVQAADMALADRWTYLPCLGVLILVVWGVCDMGRHWNLRTLAVPFIGSLMVLACVAATQRQLGYWKNSETLFGHTLQVTQNNWFIHNYLGGALYKAGKLDEAIPQYREAVRLKPDYAEAFNNLGMALSAKGSLDDAVSEFQEALRLDPNYAEAHNNLGIVLYQQRRIDEAIREFTEALRLKSDLAEAHFNLGAAFDQKGGVNDAARQFQEAIRLQPDYPNAHYQLGIALARKGQITEAIRQLEETIRLQPDHAEAHNALGMILYQQGRTDEAIREFQEAVRFTPNSFYIHYNLGMALLSKGQLNEATRHLREALRLNPDLPDARKALDAAVAKAKGATTN